MSHSSATGALDTAVAEAERRYIEANPASGARHEAACRFMPGGNTRSVLHYSPFPLTMERGEGGRLWDVDGHGYVDFLGEYTAGLYGHSHPVIVEAVRAALDGGLVLGAPNQFENELAGHLCRRFPSCDLVRFCNSGTEANLMAIGAARAATGRSHVMVFEGGYHGGVLYFAHGPSPVNAPFPYVIGRYNDLDTTLERIRPHAKALAAILVEPMMGAGGCIPGDPAFLQGLRDAASGYGIALIFDEVMTSRLSGGGLQRKLGITPDLTTFGKYLGGGLSFGAFGGAERFMGLFDPRRPDALPHAGTFNNNVLSMAAGAAGLGEVFTEEAADALSGRGDDLRQRLRACGERRGVAVQVTGTGSIMSLHYQTAPIARPEDAEATPDAVRKLTHLELIERGYVTARRGFMSLSLALSDAEIDGFVSAFDDVLASHAGALRAAPASPLETVSAQTSR
jgi:glutamate-1-semialdehyde 2,1-aminomutase